MDKAEKKRLLREYKEKQKQAFIDSLPTPKEVRHQLIDFINQEFSVSIF